MTKPTVEFRIWLHYSMWLLRVCLHVCGTFFRKQFFLVKSNFCHILIKLYLVKVLLVWNLTAQEKKWQNISFKTTKVTAVNRSGRITAGCYVLSLRSETAKLSLMSPQHLQPMLKQKMDNTQVKIGKSTKMVFHTEK